LNLYALLTGIAIAIFVVILFRRTRLENRKWLYPLLLATFPMYYFYFAIYGADYAALKIEILVGLLFFSLAFIGFKLKSSGALFVLSAGYIGHAVYDFSHNKFFLNSGAPLWWPEFCAAVDLLIGIYLLMMAISINTKQTKIKK
jgi:hypothetical protein